MTADAQNGTDIIIGFAPFISGSDARYFTLTIHPSGTIQSGQTFSLQSGSSSLVASAPSAAGSPDYISYGGTGFTTGSATVTRTGNVATFVLTNVVVRDNSTSTPTNKRLTFNAIVTVELPAQAT
ncbi:hypothetical protein EON83_23670 [bacterium]|nr:MAG: hypothetical protein EON83_23670 [bacterium]